MVNFLAISGVAKMNNNVPEAYRSIDRYDACKQSRCRFYTTGSSGYVTLPLEQLYKKDQVLTEI